MVWDDLMMRVLGITEGADAFYDFLDKLLGGYLPMIRGAGDKSLGTDLTDGVAHAAFWSRAIGRAIVVTLGPQSAVDQSTAKVTSDGQLYGRYMVGEMLSEYSMGRSKGVVYTLMDCDRSQFDGAPQ